MKADLLEFVTESFCHSGIQVLMLDKALEHLSGIDYGFRHKMASGFDYTRFFGKLIPFLEEGVHYFFEDDMKLCYLLFLFPSGQGQSDDFRLLCIGPVMPGAVDREGFSSLMEKRNIPPALYPDFLEFYNRIPVISDMDMWNHMMNFFLEKLTGQPVLFRIISMDTPELFDEDYSDYSIPDAPGVAPDTIEERYRWEDEMLLAVSAGNLKSAMEAHYHFTHYKLLPRCSDPVRDRKNILFTFNTLLRKAAQAGGVHPLHIDNLSRQLAIEIENTFTLEKLHSLSQNMLRKYCMLVNNYSGRSNSSLVRTCMDYIDFHYHEDLSLAALAQDCSVSASYLSGLFKKETNMTVTDYINTTRIRQALILLNTTSLPVGTIAQKCGFSDSNYFTRTFKKYQGLTPRAYRENIRKK